LPIVKVLKRRFIPLILVLTIILTISIVSISKALESSTPAVTAFSPAEGAVVTAAGVNITLDVSDPDYLADTGYYIKVNGAGIASNFEYTRGHWVEDTCSGGSYFVIDGYDLARVSGYASGIKDGTNTVEVQVKDRLGNTLVKTWTFNAAIKPTFTNMSPAAGSTTANSTTVSVKVTDDTKVDPASIVLAVDGSSVTPSFDAATGIVSYTFQPPLVNGPHTISISAKDMAGNQATSSWSYTVQTSGPTITFADAGKTFTTPSPSLSAWLKSTTVKLDSNGASMKVDGQMIPSTFQYKSHWYSYPYAPNGEGEWVIDSYYEGSVAGQPSGLKDGTHTLAVTSKDILGNSMTNQWNFTVMSKPAFSAAAPANGATTTDNKGFSVKVTDNDAVNPASIVVRLDNIQVPAGFDSVTGLVYYQPAAGIANGTHTVNVTVADTTGNYSAFSWSFTVQATGPEITFPDAGKTFDTHTPTINVTLKSNVKLSDTGNVIKIDGQQITGNFSYKGHMYSPPYSDNGYEEWVVDSYSDGTLTATAPSLPDGAHQLSVTAKDTLGNVTTKTFNFTVAQKPIISGLEPSGTITTRTPTIKAVIIDPNGPAIDKTSIKLIIDSTQAVPVLTDSNGAITVSYQPTLANDQTHNISVSVSDSLGGTVSSSWSFYTATRGDMPATAKDCRSCHTLTQYNKYKHSVAPDAGLTGSGGTCGHCHKMGLVPNEFCYYCHDGNPWDIHFGQASPDPSIGADTNCSYCHGVDAFSYVQRKVILNKPSKQLSSWYLLSHNIVDIHYVSKPDCMNCHSGYLTREHNRVTKAGVQITCATCHESTNPAVQQAIAAKNKDCTACHITRTDHEAMHTSGLDSNCQTCHKAVLTQEHLNNTTTAGKGYTCETCHANTGKEVKRTINASNLNCAGCHKQGHNVNFADNVPADIPLYAGFQWSLPIEATIFAGEPATPVGYDSGQVVQSNRRTDITAEQIWAFYNSNLIAQNGWTLKSGAPAAGAQSFTAEFTKGSRSVTVKCFNSANRDGTGIQIGYRIEIWYK